MNCTRLEGSVFFQIQSEIKMKGYLAFTAERYSVVNFIFMPVLIFFVVSFFFLPEYNGTLQVLWPLVTPAIGLLQCADGCASEDNVGKWKQRDVKYMSDPESPSFIHLVGLRAASSKDMPGPLAHFLSAALPSYDTARPCVKLLLDSS